MQKIGQLFLLRTNINSVGSVLDSPVRVIALVNDYQTDFFKTGNILGTEVIGPMRRLWLTIVRVIQIYNLFTMRHVVTSRYLSGLIS